MRVHPDVGAIPREHVEAFVEDLLGRWKPATAANRYKALQQLFRWLVDEGEVRESPMARMRPPKLPEEPPEILREPELRMQDLHLKVRRPRRPWRCPSICGRKRGPAPRKGGMPWHP